MLWPGAACVIRGDQVSMNGRAIGYYSQGWVYRFRGGSVGYLGTDRVSLWAQGGRFLGPVTWA
jgi:hypothetical protein